VYRSISGVQGCRSSSGVLQGYSCRTVLLVQYRGIGVLEEYRDSGVVQDYNIPAAVQGYRGTEVVQGYKVAGVVLGCRCSVEVQMYNEYRRSTRE